MSKYTTEVRYICEQKADLSESVGFDKIEEVLDKSYNKIFSDFPIFDENYRKTLCCNILRHFYTKEICAETTGLWLHWLNETMYLIMPYYNELYKTTLYDINPLYDVDVKTTSTRTTDGNNSNGGSITTTDITNSNNTNKTTNDLNNRELYSDTPQGNVNLSDASNYLTSVKNNSNTGTTSTTITESGNNTTETVNNLTGSIHNIDEYVEHVVGKNSGSSYAKMIIEYRQSLINIDLMIIKELNDLFMGLW